MASRNEEELGKKLYKAGKRLKRFPLAKDDLLCILDTVESCFLEIDQVDSMEIKIAMFPAMKYLVKSKLLRHLEEEVRLVVASCINGIMRITAPQVPYDSSIMKEVFQLIVGSFRSLGDIGNPSFAKRVKILDIVAKIRSCVIMLDLGYEDLIFKMFHLFLGVVNENH